MDLLESGTKSDYTLIYSWVTDFKRRAFSCTNVEYNSVTGRVNKMEFVEQSLDNYDYR